MKVLVTGHRGYVGAVLVPLLLAQGHRVVGVDCNLFENCSFSPLTAPHQSIAKDIRDLTAADFHGVDGVIHLAALSNDPLGEINPDLTHEINTVATQRLARHAKGAGVKRFVFSSSCSNYGAADDGWLTEESALNPLTPYAVSKARSEELLDALADDDFSPVFLRSGTAYGLSPQLRCDLVANNLTAYAVATGEVLLKSDGSAWRPLVHVEDMSRAFIAALEADTAEVHRQVFNVGRNADCMKIRDLAALVGDAVPGSRIEFASGHAADERTYRVDCSKIKRIGFLPQRQIGEAVQEMAVAFREFAISQKDFEGPRFVRLAMIRKLIGAGLLDASLREVLAA